MKKSTVKLCAAVMASVSALSACSYAEPEGRPMQEILFVITDDADGGGYGSVIDINGCCRELPDPICGSDGIWFDNWYEKALESECYPVKKTVSGDKLGEFYSFVNSAEDFISAPLIDCGQAVPDSGNRSLYMLYRAPDGYMNYKLLCTYGDSVSCVDSDEVRRFVNSLSDSGHFLTQDFRY